VTGTGGSSSPALGVNDLTADPAFAGVGGEAWQPALGNVVLDAGDPASYPTVDILGVSRPQKAGPSMGAYESGPALPLGTMLLIR
jgi:hypothetical protein